MQKSLIQITQIQLNSFDILDEQEIQDSSYKDKIESKLKLEFEDGFIFSDRETDLNPWVLEMISSEIPDLSGFWHDSNHPDGIIYITCCKEGKLVIVDRDNLDAESWYAHGVVDTEGNVIIDLFEGNHELQHKGTFNKETLEISFEDGAMWKKKNKN